MPIGAELERLIRSGREGIGIEFKASMNWSDAATKGKVIRAALAMANNRDGGVLALGVVQQPNAGTHSIVGMSEGDWQSFTQDAVIAKVNAHATPQIDLSVERGEIDGLRVVAIVVRQFADYPVICSQEFGDGGRPVVQRGRLYCRSRRMAESTELQTADDLRDIIELAIARGLERYFRLRQIEQAATQPNAQAGFDAQVRDLGL